MLISGAGCRESEPEREREGDEEQKRKDAMKDENDQPIPHEQGDVRAWE
jgi:hypothetical protein